MPSPHVFRGLALALALALTPTASVLGAAAPVSGLTDASPLVTRAGAPDASLCEDGESGHRKATTAGDAHLKLDELDEAEALYQEALDGRRRTLGETHPATLQLVEVLKKVRWERQAR